jgi:hypothetical protein
MSIFSCKFLCSISQRIISGRQRVSYEDFLSFMVLGVIGELLLGRPSVGRSQISICFSSWFLCLYLNG